MQELDVKLSFPREVVNILKTREEYLGPLLKEKVALELFREGLVSVGKASEIAGLTRNDMLDLLASKKIPLHYTPSDLREDIEALEKS